jgi:tetratricopeptide (TPR) repeat protein
MVFGTRNSPDLDLAKTASPNWRSRHHIESIAGFPYAYQETISLVRARFGSVTEPALREQVAKALYDKGITLNQLGRSEEAVAVYDDLLARFGTAAEPELRRQVAKALYDKGFTLDQLGRSEEAIAVYDDLLARFGSVTEPALREQVARAKSARDRSRNSWDVQSRPRRDGVLDARLLVRCLLVQAPRVMHDLPPGS